jgi:hypothetical protein
MTLAVISDECENREERDVLLPISPPFRRRREAETGYAQRSSLVQQDKTKYGPREYCLVARIANTPVIAQITSAEINHDVTICPTRFSGSIWRPTSRRQRLRRRSHATHLQHALARRPPGCRIDFLARTVKVDDGVGRLHV